LARDHLDLHELACLAEGSRTDRGTLRDQAQIEDARQHWGKCGPCQRLVEMYGDLQRRFGPAGASTATPAGADCPSEFKWWRLASGVLSESETVRLLEHSDSCDSCAPLLKRAMLDFVEEESEEESAYVGSLQSAQPEWQRSMAQRLIGAQPGRKKGRSATTSGGWLQNLADRFAFLRPGWAYAGLAIALVAGVTWFVHSRREPSVDHLIANAYTQQRPFELRIAGAGYGPVRKLRGPKNSTFAQPADLLRAEILIKERLAAKPNDLETLAASGRVELLEGNYDEAIRTFGRLLDAQPNSPALLTDLATAYFQRAAGTGRAADSGQSIELLGRALAKNPDEPLALFNRAIALEGIFAYNEAIRDWEHYLRLDPSSAWADEARSRLGELQKKIKARDGPAAMLQSDPIAAVPLLRARADSQSTSPTAWPASLDEEYLDLAVRQWLAALYISADSSDQQQWRRQAGVWDALTAVAAVLRSRHSDPWLTDVLRESPADSAPKNAAESYVKALDLLSQATKANAAGDPDSARPLAESAARLFRAARSDPGYLRAREEIIYSHVRAARVHECIETAEQQLREVKLPTYPWLQGQAILWDATCQGYAGNFGLAEKLSDQAFALTEKTGYSGQHLRSVLFASGFLRSSDRNWQYTRDGLQKFWDELHNPFHAYESYLELAILADEAEQRYLAIHLYREAVEMIEKTPDRSFQAAAHYRLAVAAMRIQDLAEAEREFKVTDQQFAAHPLSETDRLYRGLAEIQWAAVAVQQGRLDLAAARLEQGKPNVPDAENAFQYYETLGELQFRRNKLPDAEQALRGAVNIAEVELNSLLSDTDRLAWVRDSAPAYRTLIEIISRKPGTTMRALAAWEGFLASPISPPGPLSQKRPIAATSDTDAAQLFFVRLKSALPMLKHETVMSYAYLPSGIAVWMFDDRGVKFAWVAGSKEELNSRIRDFAHLCADPYSDVAKLRQEGRHLYDSLVAPFEQQFEPNRLLVVEPDSLLSDVPWQALVDTHGEYLGSRQSMVVSPGLGYWLRLRSSAPISPERTALVVGMPALSSVVASRFAPLPEADREAQNVAIQFRRSRLLSGPDVTSTSIRQELAQSDVFHFAGHAVSGVKKSGLVLATSANASQDSDAGEPTLLSAADLDTIVLRRLQLVVLSACATAETEKGFTGPDTLVRGFLRAGVPHVVASRWPVDSESTKQVMAKLYPYLLQGVPVDQALQQAADELRLQPATAHPYYWAAFGSYGR